MAKAHASAVQITDQNRTPSARIASRLSFIIGRLTAKLTRASMSASLVKIPSIIPTSLPSARTRAPPEAPGLTPASVCTKSSNLLNPSSLRHVPETTPQVNEIPIPKELTKVQVCDLICGSPAASIIGAIN